jgi:hypothetical protein
MTILIIGGVFGTLFLAVEVWAVAQDAPRCALSGVFECVADLLHGAIRAGLPGQPDATVRGHHRVDPHADELTSVQLLHNDRCVDVHAVPPSRGLELHPSERAHVTQG